MVAAVESNRSKAHSSDTATSLASHLNSLFVSGSPERILRSLRTEELSAPPLVDPAEHALAALRISRPVDADYSDVVARRIATAIDPAIRKHARTFKGKAATIIVGTGDAFQHLDEKALAMHLNVDLNGRTFAELQEELQVSSRKIGLKIVKSILYNVRLGNSDYCLLALRCSKGPNGRERFEEWRHAIHQKYGVKICFTAEQQSKTKAPVDTSQAYLRKRAENYYTHVRHQRLPKHLRGKVEDWRDLELFSVDCELTIEPEDMQRVIRTDKGFTLKFAIPCLGNTTSSFSPFADRYCFGITAKVGFDGEVQGFYARLAIAHNSEPLDSFLALQALGANAALSRHRQTRVASVRSNLDLRKQLTNFSELTSALLKQKSESGHVLPFEIAPVPNPSVAVSVIGPFAQQLLARWILTTQNAPPLIARRMNFKPEAMLDKIHDLIPSFTEADLLFPKKRIEAVRALELLGRQDLVKKFAESILRAYNQPSLVLVKRECDLRPEDRFYFKTRKHIGLINNAQAMQALYGSPGLLPSELHVAVEQLESWGTPQFHEDRRRFIIERIGKLDPTACAYWA